VPALVLTRLDYDNSLLAGRPYSTIAPLQRVVVDAAARLARVRETTPLTDATVELVALAADRRADTVQTVCSSTEHVLRGGAAVGRWTCD